MKFILEHGKHIPVELVPAGVLVSKQWEVIDNAIMYFITNEDIFFQAWDHYAQFREVDSRLLWQAAIITSFCRTIM